MVKFIKVGGGAYYEVNSYTIQRNPLYPLLPLLFKIKL